MLLPRPTDGYLQKAQDAEERAQSTSDLEMKARWLGIAFGYRELARFRQQVRERAAVAGEFPQPTPPASPLSPRN